MTDLITRNDDVRLDQPIISAWDGNLFRDSLRAVLAELEAERQGTHPCPVCDSPMVWSAKLDGWRCVECELQAANERNKGLEKEGDRLKGEIGISHGVLMEFVEWLESNGHTVHMDTDRESPHYKCYACRMLTRSRAALGGKR